MFKKLLDDVLDSLAIVIYMLVYAPLVAITLFIGVTALCLYNIIDRGQDEDTVDVTSTHTRIQNLLRCFL